MKLKYIFIVLLVLSSFNIVKWVYDSSKTNNQIKEINKQVKVKETKDNDNTVVVESNEDKSNPYWDYIKMNLINVDFSNLLTINSETKGWIQVPSTNINYPFVQNTNNSFYLEHSFDKSYNSAGWVFMDYRNNNLVNKNTILYAHGRYDGTMFGSLKNIFNSSWYENKNNHIVRLSTLDENSMWQVFSVYTIPTTNDYIKVNFKSDEEFLSWAEMIKKRSRYNFNTVINSSDNILTLSTCYNKTEKVVMHAKLIKKEAR